MLEVAEELKFEYAAKLRDEIKDLERQLQEEASKMNWLNLRGTC